MSLRPTHISTWNWNLLFWIVTLTLTLSSSFTLTGALPEMRIATYNIRFDSLPDDIRVQESLRSIPNPLVPPSGYLEHTDEQPWSTRRLRISERLLGENVTIVGLQEALIRQVRDLTELLGDDWAWVGVGRDDGVESGEFCPIFYKTTEVRLLSNDTFWLSNTPFEPSRYPGAGSYRLCTAARFEALNPSQTSPSNPSDSPKRFTLLNTHLDDRSDDQRQLAASMLLARARYEAVNTNDPVFVMGDFNSASTGDDSSAYNITTGFLSPVSLPASFSDRYSVDSDQLPNFRMADSRAFAPRDRVSNTYATFTGFSKPDDTRLWTRIDFVFGGSNGGWRTDAYKVETARSDDGILASDHRPVFVDITL